jgi:hypothetical protein
MRLVREGWGCYSRRSNEVDPLISCRAAAMIQALDAWPHVPQPPCQTAKTAQPHLKHERSAV